MNTSASPTFHPLISRRATRLLALKVLTSTVQAREVTKSELVDDDESMAQLLGTRRHRQFVVQAEALEESEQLGINRILSMQRLDAAVSNMAIRCLDDCRERLLSRGALRPDHIELNVRSLASLLDLGEIETRLVEFAVRAEIDDCVFKACSIFHAQSHHGEIRFQRLVARILDCSRRDIAEALGPESQLSVTGLLGDTHCKDVHGRRTSMRTDFSELALMSGVSESISSHGFDFDRIFSTFFRKQDSSTLDITDFDFMADTVEVLRALFAGALKSRARGVQILLYGAPGTGKSELARVIADAVGARAYGIASESAQGAPYHRDDRFRCLRIARYALKARPSSLLIFDEIEDVFPNRLGTTNDDSRQKGWLNGMLESSPVPGIWITNSLSEIDQAYLRRFNLVVKMTRPPRATRQLMAERYLGDLPLAPGFLQRVADKPEIRVADLSRTAHTLALVGDTRDLTGTAATVLAAGTALVRAREFQDNRVFRLAEFDPKLVHTDFDISRLTSQLAVSQEGRLCFYGPPGTGKTALAVHIAKAVNRELITISASSWLSCWLGQTEQLIRASFDEADASGSVLFVDEADTFLRDRALATQPWERSQVNELLKCLEESRGIVIFATNAFDTLDPSVLRRLDIKAEFRSLSSDQAIDLLRATLAANSLELDDGDWATIERLRTVPGIVGGDFAAACRRVQVCGDALTARSLATAVAEEVELRNRHQSTAVGFI